MTEWRGLFSARLVRDSLLGDAAESIPGSWRAMRVPQK